MAEFPVQEIDHKPEQAMRTINGNQLFDADGRPVDVPVNDDRDDRDPFSDWSDEDFAAHGRQLDAETARRYAERLAALDLGDELDPLTVAEFCGW